ncbi:MAG: M14 family zinc carboxypeptidase, partial [Rubricoccaceae bacterium]|nr:M14 family zinc carboxypeptidase [Rubricoccaceae bacterium]
DGYVYNEVLDSDGQYPGWRKNCRVNADGGVCCILASSGECGVDLNRNYGYLWGYDNSGSSSNPGSSTYRGESEFSEPETSAIRDFLENERYVTQAFNYHTYSELLLYPWGYESGAYTPDNSTFIDQSIQLTSINGYTYGTPPDILYLVNGSSDDWMYGEQTTKPKILAYTPEVGYSFWPNPADIIPLADENLEANLWLAGFVEDFPVGLYEEVEDHPNGFVLGANYPNPFNPETRIPFVLNEPGDVSLRILDVLGREVASLLEGPQTAGAHVVSYDATNLSSGTYAIVLEVNGAIQTGQMLLLK